MVPDVIFKTTSALSLGNCHHRWCKQCIWHSRVNHAGMDTSVSYPPYGLSPLWSSWGRICCIFYYSLEYSLLIYYGYGVPRSLGTPPPSLYFRLDQHLVGVHNLIPHPPLWVVSWFTFLPLDFIILPSYNGVGCFGSILLDKGIYGLLESLGVYLERRPVLLI